VTVGSRRVIHIMIRKAEWKWFVPWQAYLFNHNNWDLSWMWLWIAPYISLQCRRFTVTIQSTMQSRSWNQALLFVGQNESSVLSRAEVIHSSGTTRRSVAIWNYANTASSLSLSLSSPSLTKHHYCSLPSARFEADFCTCIMWVLHWRELQLTVWKRASPCFL
jgi:hypothetical protein